MSDRNHVFVILTGAIIIISLFIITGVTDKKRMSSAKEQSLVDIEAVFERELSADTKLQEQVRDFFLPANILKLFHEHEEQLNTFVEGCYINRVPGDHFFVKYIDGQRFYFCSSDTDLKGGVKKNTAIKNGEHSYVTSFMDYMIDSGLAFRDWMSDIYIYGSVKNMVDKNNQDGVCNLHLTITLYETYGAKIFFRYSSLREKDYSGEYFIDGGDCNRPGGLKSVRINENWYYEYEITDGVRMWHPDYEDMAFACGPLRTTTIMKHFLIGNLRGFLRLYWKYGTDFTKIGWSDWDEFRWTEPHESEPMYEIPAGDAKLR